MADLVINQAQINPFENFCFGLRSKETQRQYPKLLNIFLDFILSDNSLYQNNIVNNDLEAKCSTLFSYLKENPEWVQQKIMSFVNTYKKRVENHEISSGTLKNYVKVLKFFCDMNNIHSINWKIIYRGLPPVKQYSDDRVPTLDEIKRLIDFDDRRIKVIVLTMVSSGIRVGAWDFLKWKHVIPIRIENMNNEVVAAKLVVYGGQKEEYYSFITAEAYNAIQQWMDFRASFGEKITGDSWILRDIWQKTSIRYSHNIGMATNPKQFKSVAVKTLIGRALQIQGVRKPLDLKSGEKRHEFKTVHGFRKFFKTTCEKVMKSINVELLLGHNIGLSNSYYRSSENELLEDYLKAVDSLTIIKVTNKKLEKEIEDLKEKNQNNEYTIRAKLQEKDDAYIALSDQVMKLMEEVQQLKMLKR
jgi:integrase